METTRLFLASSAELKADREAFELFIYRKTKDWKDRGVFLELAIWEDFLDAMSRTRLQDEYDRAIRGCDLFVMLFWTKVGRYTEEEFDTAFGQFQATRKPFIFTYFKDAPPATADPDNKASLEAFKTKLKALGHFYTRYRTTDGLLHHFHCQLDKLAAKGFISFEPDRDGTAEAAIPTHRATLTGSSGAIAQGGGDAVGAGGVLIGGDNSGDVNTGTRIDTGGGAYVGGNVDTGGGSFVGRDQVIEGMSPRELEPLFAPLLAAVARHASAEQQPEALRQVRELQAEVARGEAADDSRLGTILDGLAALVPGAIGELVGLFAKPVLQGVAGPVTRFVLGKVRGP